MKAYMILRRMGELPQPHSVSKFWDAGGVEDVTPGRRIIPGISFWRVLCVGSWNVLSLLEDHRLPHLSDELIRLKVDMVGLSETSKPESGETNSKGFTYYCVHGQWSLCQGESHRHLQQTAGARCRGYSG